MTEPFSTNDVYYTKATDCDTITNTSNGCIGTTSDTANCECKYKENVDKLNNVISSNGLTKSQNGDMNTEQSLLIMNSISLGIGIVSMMWIMS